MVAAKDLSGMKFGKLLVVSRRGSNKHGKATWDCVCDCGGKTVSVGGNLVSGVAKSCGCKQREAARNTLKTHGLSKTKEYARAKNSRMYHKKKSDPLFAASIRVRALIRDSFNKNGYSKSSLASEILGCTYEEFKRHIERQFVNGMCWERFSEIHIDHIVPLASAKTEQEVFALCHFTNLRPMFGVDNMRKNAKREFLI